MCRKSSFRLRAGSPHGVMWRRVRFVCGLAARRGLRCAGKALFAAAGWQPADGLCQKRSFRLRAGSPQRRDVAKSSCRLQAGCPQRPYVPKKLFSFRRLRAGSPQKPFAGKLFSSAGCQPARRDVAKEFVSSVGWQPAEALCAGKALFVCGLAARRGLICAGKARFVCRLAARKGLTCAGKALFVCGLAARTA